jgi:hypothetical protein
MAAGATKVGQFIGVGLHLCQLSPDILVICQHSSPSDASTPAVDGDSFRADKPRPWSDGRVTARPRTPSRDLDLHPDGERFALAGTTDQATAKQDKLVFIFNFFDELRRLSPPTKR